jgi:hypothetical protein
LEGSGVEVTRVAVDLIVCHVRECGGGGVGGGDSIGSGGGGGDEGVSGGARAQAV